MMDYAVRRKCFFPILALSILFLIPMAFSSSRAEEAMFAIYSFRIEGNTVLEKELLTQAVKDFTGDQKTAEDVELARDALERLYHQTGYPTVLVNIPEQTVDDGIVRFDVIESRIKRVHVVGNKYYTMEHIKESLPGIQPGTILFLPRIRGELMAINRNPDLKVAPILVPGRELGTINVELKVEDKLPLHGNVELNNRSTHTTTETRLNGTIRYDNLWQKDHSITGQFQTAPEDVDEVMTFSVSYALPAFWNKNHLMIGYFIHSDSETASGEGFNVIGKGKIFGVRYMLSLPEMPDYDHNLTLGFDWKSFEEDVQGEIVPIEYVPFTAGYASSLIWGGGITRFSADVNFLFRDLFVNDMEEFQAKRAGATGNYIYLTAGVEHRQKLPWDFSLFCRIDGQVADQPLVNNEQYSAGGVTSVRGYKESEILSDNALHGTVELFGPSLMKKHTVLPYLFYDVAWLANREPLPGEDEQSFIHGTGLGLTGNWKDKVEFKIDMGVALEDTDNTNSGDIEIHFKTKYQF